MEQLLKITTVPISYELKVSNARLERKSGTAELEISRDKGGMHIKSRPVKLNIDTFEARNSVVPTLKTSIYQAAQKGMNCAYETTARYAGEGKTLMQAKPGEGNQALNQILANRSPLPAGDFELSFVPKAGVEISASQPEITIQYQMDKLNFDWKVDQGSVEFIPGDVSISITEFPDVLIEYVGGPFYVPPSTAEHFNGGASGGGNE